MMLAPPTFLVTDLLMFGRSPFLALFLLAGLTPGLSQAGPQVLLETNVGNITLELDADKAPRSTANFLKYVREKHYNGLIFHRVIHNFMIQGGGYDRDYHERKTQAPIPNEARNGLKNQRGTVAMARTSDPHSATAQFFINHTDNNFLDAPGQDGWGYAVFGKVIQGMDIVDKIAAAPTRGGEPFGSDIPVKQVVIKKASELKPAPELPARN